MPNSGIVGEKKKKLSMSLREQNERTENETTESTVRCGPLTRVPPSEMARLWVMSDISVCL